jgi:hypothetical protein
MQEWIVPTVVGVLALLALALATALWRVRAGTARELRAAHAEAASLRAQVEEIERRLSARSEARTRAETEYVITHVGEDPQGVARHAADAEPIDRALFADLVLRETVVKAASLAHGLRRALAPETRNRIRFEMRREVKRARKQRRSEMREARRDWAARQRAVMSDDLTDGVAGDAA